MTEQSEKQKIEIQGISTKLFGVLEITNAQVSNKSDNLSKFEEKQTEVLQTVSTKMVEFQERIDEDSALLRHVEEMSFNTDAAVKKILGGSQIQSGLMQAKMVDVLANFMEEQVNMYNDPNRNIRKILKTKYKDD